MTATDDLEVRLADFYADESGVRAPDWVLRATLDAVDATHQRSRFIAVAWREPKMTMLLRLAYAALAVVVVGVTAIAIVRPSEPSAAIVGAPPTASPVGSPIRELAAWDYALEPGAYALGPGVPPMVIDLPSGWFNCSANLVEQGVCPQGSTAEISFMMVVNVVADPCAQALLDPPVGPTVDDMVAAISNLKGFRATTPVDIVIDGHPGKAFTVTAPANASCDLRTWASARRTNVVAEGEANELRIIDVDGARVLIAAAYQPTVDAPDPPIELEQVLDSIRLGP